MEFVRKLSNRSSTEAPQPAAMPQPAPQSLAASYFRPFGFSPSPWSGGAGDFSGVVRKPDRAHLRPEVLEDIETPPVSDREDDFSDDEDDDFFDGPYEVFVGGLRELGNSVDEEELRAYFEGFGSIDKIELTRDRRRHDQRGFCFITFARKRDALVCLEHKLHQVRGMEIVVERATRNTTSARIQPKRRTRRSRRIGKLTTAKAIELEQGSSYGYNMMIPTAPPSAAASPMPVRMQHAHAQQQPHNMQPQQQNIHTHSHANTHTQVQQQAPAKVIAPPSRMRLWSPRKTQQQAPPPPPPPTHTHTQVSTPFSFRSFERPMQHHNAQQIHTQQMHTQQIHAHTQSPHHAQQQQPSPFHGAGLGLHSQQQAPIGPPPPPPSAGWYFWRHESAPPAPL